MSGSMRIALLAAGTLLLGGCASTTSVRDLEDRPLDPLAVKDARAVVLVFTDSECPIANAYSPELRRLRDEFAPRGVRFFLVYADGSRTLVEVRAHVAAYAQPMEAVRDPEHELVRRAGATRTPEACVFLPGGELVYRGRIDDRYVDFGKQRAAPTTRDLRDALEAVLSGGTPAEPWGPAIGCTIPDR